MHKNKKVVRIIWWALLILLIVFLYKVFWPRHYNVQSREKEINSTFWQLSTGSTIGYTYISSTSKETSFNHPDGSSLILKSKKTGDTENIVIKSKLRPFKEIVDVIRQYVSKPIVLGPGVEPDVVVEELTVNANSGLALAHEVAEKMGFKVIETEQNFVIE